MSSDDFVFLNTGISIEKDQLYVETANNKIISNKPIGISTPLTKGFRNNESLFKMHYVLENQIDDNLKNLLMTKKGERLGFASFGTNLVKIFSLTNSTKDEIEEIAMSEINKTVSTYMPFLELLDFSSEIDEDLSNKKETTYKLIISYIIPAVMEKPRSISLKLRTSN